jgi:hypothetical protein
MIYQLSLDMNDILATLSRILHEYPGSLALLVYQERNFRRNIYSLMNYWNLVEVAPHSQVKSIEGDCLLK